MTGISAKILLVDDDPTILRLVGKWLELAGFDARTAGDGLEAMGIIRSDCPHVLLTDWNMPRLNGLDLCSWLRSETLPHYVYSIILTGRDTQDDVVRGLDAGADDFLKKPIDRNELLARLNAGMRIVELENQLSELARTDPLTRLYNQRTFYDLLECEWDRTLRHTKDLSCVVMDLDFFKRINDTYGHPVGDEVIRRMSDVLRINSRASDVVSRYGGEEFCALLPETTEEQAYAWAERVRVVLTQTIVSVADKQLKFSASFGVAQVSPDVVSPQDLVDRADQALLVAKQSGRNRVVGFESLSDTSSMKADEDGPAAILRGRVARDAMTTVVAPLVQLKPIAYAARYFLRFRIGSAPVVNQFGDLVGVLSEKDLLAVMLEPNWWSGQVQDVMKENVVSYEETTPLTTIYDFLCRVSVRAVAIVREGKPVGVISRSDLVHWVINAVTSLLPSDELQDTDGIDGEELRENMLQMSRELCFQAHRLEQSLEVSREDDDLIPCVVGATTRIQELATDQLSHLRYITHLRWNAQNSTAADIEGLTGQEGSGVWFPPGCQPDVAD